MVKKKEKEKPVRVQFPKDSTAKNILSSIRKLQDDWAKRHPEKAHQLYPQRYGPHGDVIVQPPPPEPES